MTSLTIIIPVKNDAKRLQNCLASLAGNRSSRASASIIVADNGSTDESPAVASAAGARVMVLPGLRVSQLRNAAAHAAAGDALAFVDADHEVASFWLDAAADTIAGSGIGAVGALYVPPNPGTWVQRAYGALRGRTVGRQDVPWLGSGNLIVRREAFLKIGGFDESLEACEDVDFCQRLRADGWRIVADERIHSTHLGDPPTLAALFRAERWRGRDNLKVSLRGPLSLRDIPSVVTPIVTLAALIAIIGSPAVAWLGRSSWAFYVLGAAIIAIGGLTALKAARMAMREERLSFEFVVQAFIVALVYDLARAIALMTRAPHHRR